MHVYIQNENERTVFCGGWRGIEPNTDVFFFFPSVFLSLLPSFNQYLTTQVLNASLPVPDVSEDNLKPDASPQEPLQLEAVTASKELDGQQPEVASPLQEPPREQTESAGTNGKCKPVFSGHTIEACVLNGMRSRNGARLGVCY